MLVSCTLPALSTLLGRIGSREGRSLEKVLERSIETGGRRILRGQEEPWRVLSRALEESPLECKEARGGGRGTDRWLEVASGGKLGGKS